jgi:putative ABC transport system permease protein
MLKTYLKLAVKVLARRKFFTFVSLFGISFTLAVLVLASALVDHAVAPFPPEVHQDRTLGVYFAALHTAKVSMRNASRSGHPSAVSVPHNSVACPSLLWSTTRVSMPVRVWP